LSARAWESLLAWYFVTIWGSGFLATKIGLQHAAPFTFLSLRFAFGILCLTVLVLVLKPRWPATRVELGHVIVAGLLMHAVHLGGSHYSQYLGLSAGITAVLLSVQPLLTALLAPYLLSERVTARQWLGVGLGLAGVLARLGGDGGVRRVVGGRGFGDRAFEAVRAVFCFILVGAVGGIGGGVLVEGRAAALAVGRG
jgi:drug/metabolite transporter (DMT)-like permease